MRRSARPLFHLAPLLLGTLLASPSLATLSLAVELSFTGATISTSGFLPPDTMGAVGEEHVVQFVNGLFGVYRKSDGALIDQRSNLEFWADAGLQSSDTFDPRIVYDESSQRWFALEAANRRSADSSYFFAVSSSSDPTGPWTGFSIEADPNQTSWVDFPMIGIDDQGVYLSASMYRNVDDANSGASIVVLPKADLLAATPSIANATLFDNIPPGEISYTPQPATNFDGTGPMSMLASTGIASVLQLVQVEGPVTAPTLSGLLPDGLLFVEGGTLSELAEQPAGAAPVDADGFFTSRLVQRDGSLWGVRSILEDDRPAVQWFEIDPGQGIVLQSGLIADDELNLYYPSISVNEFDQIVIGMNGSSENQFISVYAVAGETVGGITSFGDLVLLHEGLDTYEIVARGRNRWGDYSATVGDPNDPNVFWTFQEWADEGGSSWSTQILKLVLVPEPTTALLLGFGAILLASGTRARRA